MSGLTELSDREKMEIALGAAMGAGCRTCAEKLQGMLVSAGATPDELEPVFAEGLAVRDEATATMRRKVRDLQGRSTAAEPRPKDPAGKGITGLIRVAAAVAANSSPDAVGHIEEAMKTGATDAQISMAMEIARTVRSKAQGFSDAELNGADEKPSPGEDAGAGCPLVANPAADAPGPSACC